MNNSRETTKTTTRTLTQTRTASHARTKDFEEETNITSMSKETSCSPGSSEKGDTSTCEPDPEDFISISVTSQLLQDPYYISLVGDFIIWETEKYLKIVKQLDENETVSEHVVPQLDMDPNISESFIRGLPQVIQQWRVLYALHGRMLTIRVCPFELHELVWVAFPVHIALCI